MTPAQQALREAAAVKRDCTCPRARHEHGTRLAYNTDRCRCLDCTAAIIAHQRDYRRRKAVAHWAGKPFILPPEGTQRRLRALAAAGWTWRDLAPRLGVTYQAVSDLARNRPKFVMAETAKTVADLYAELADRPAPPGWVRERTARHAARLGWHPPIAWDDDTIDDPAAQPYAGMPVELDELAVELAIEGRRVPLRKPERVEAVRQMIDRYTVSVIAERLGVTARQVERDKAEARGRVA